MVWIPLLPIIILLPCFQNVHVNHGVRSVQVQVLPVPVISKHNPAVSQC